MQDYHKNVLIMENFRIKLDGEVMLARVRI